MKKILYCLVILSFFTTTAQNKPRIVIGIVVDQMRQEYLLRFSDKFSDDGFKRLMNDGFDYKNAHYNYVPTYTAPGHASIYTGTTPSNHGIIGNSWYSRDNDLSIYCVSDPDQSGVGGSNANGKMSPKNLLSSTITDELMLTTNFRSKVVGVSIKDRGSVLPAGHNPTGAYWFDSKTGNFMTSTYYTDKLPSWVDRFNRKKIATNYLNNTWDTMLPIEEYVESTADDAPYEIAFKGKEEAIFPYDLKELAKSNGVGLIRSTPYGNSMVLDMAIAAIEGEKLGEDPITDFLAISFSSTDYIGHQFGANSIELEDTYLRLDLELKRLFDYLDENFDGSYTLFLTSDHGVVNVPLFLEDNNMVGGYLKKEDAARKLREKIEVKLGEGDWISDVSNDQIFLNREFIVSKGLDFTEVSNVVKEIALELDEIEDALTREEILKRNANHSYAMRIGNGFHRKRSGDIANRLKPGYLTISAGYGVKGTSHGSGYTYDTHIPIIFYGSGVKKGSSVRQVSITDIAPTLSMLLGISLPNASTGSPLKELFE